jgi:hypothetical protein
MPCYYSNLVGAGIRYSILNCPAQYIMSVCPRGYFSALKMYYPFPTYEAMRYARDICDGKRPDLDGVQKVSNNNYISVKVPDINGFTRRHAERWVNVCYGAPCTLGEDDSRSQSQYDGRKKLSDANKKRLSDITVLYRELLRGGILPFGQVLHNGKAIGILDTDRHFHICRPSVPLTEVNIVEL